MLSSFADMHFHSTALNIRRHLALILHYYLFFDTNALSLELGISVNHIEELNFIPSAFGPFETGWHREATYPLRGQRMGE